MKKKKFKLIIRNGVGKEIKALEFDWASDLISWLEKEYILVINRLGDKK